MRENQEKGRELKGKERKEQARSNRERERAAGDLLL